MVDRTTSDISGTKDALPKQRVPRRTGITPRSLDVLKAIAALLKARGYSPSYAEIGAAVELTSLATVSHHVALLEQAELIVRSVNVQRSIELTERGRKLANGRAA